MKVFTSEQIRRADLYTMANEPVASIDLMERASIQLAVWITERIDHCSAVKIFAGPGNNGGDAWALARLLYDKNFKNIAFYLLDLGVKRSADSLINEKRLLKLTSIKVNRIESPDDFPKIYKEDVLIDGLFGSGLTRKLNGLNAELVKYLNSSVKEILISIDVPSGLFGEDNRSNDYNNVIIADYTLCFQSPKQAFFYQENSPYVGQWQVLPIGLHPDFINSEATDYFFLEKKTIQNLIKKRVKFSHKGCYGHALIIAGSYGMMGAAVLATRAAVHTGSGLVTCHTPRLGYEIIQTTVPEAIVSIDQSDLIFTGQVDYQKYTAIGVGPGINTKSDTHKALATLLECYSKSLVIDADAINIISKDEHLLNNLPAGTILTPHPGEFDRLTRKHYLHQDRVESQIAFSKKHRVYVILKGAHTSISTPEGKLWFNTTGNPGMATGGCGDVLTGIITSLLTQGYSAEDSSKIGVFLHGLAGDLVARKHGEHFVSAGKIITNLGKSFKKILSDA